RLVDQSGKKGWQKLGGSQRGQVHPGSIGPDAVGTRPSSRERTWPPFFLGAGERLAPAALKADWMTKWG
ncbi:MAG: hypothetical protein WB773_20490, partial [Isosphaeraceae bacterium]